MTTEILFNNIRYKVIFDAALDENDQGMTDFSSCTIAINKNLHPDLIYSTLLHELCHAYRYAYGFPLNNVTQEELCDFMAMNSLTLIEAASNLMIDYSENLKNENSAKDKI